MAALADLDMANVLDEAKARWMRPNEIHAILCNHKYFNVQVKPVTLPPSMSEGGRKGDHVQPLNFLHTTGMNN